MPDLIYDAFRQAQASSPGKTARLDFKPADKSLTMQGEKKALQHAVFEVMLNALQANPEDPRVSVEVQEQGGNGNRSLAIEIGDAGPGFTEDSARQAGQPFYSTKNVGLGLGLTVSRRIFENHRGNLQIVTGSDAKRGLVRLSCPLEGAMGAPASFRENQFATPANGRDENS